MFFVPIFLGQMNEMNEMKQQQKVESVSSIAIVYHHQSKYIDTYSALAQTHTQTQAEHLFTDTKINVSNPPITSFSIVIRSSFCCVFA